jgi:hypothetical protein
LLKGPDEQRIGEILRTSGKVYKVEHEMGKANAVGETLTLGQLHRRMGHSSVQVIRDLIKKDMVTGICLEYTLTSKPCFCESCVHAKAIHKPDPNFMKAIVLKYLMGSLF